MGQTFKNSNQNTMKIISSFLFALVIGFAVQAQDYSFNIQVKGAGQPIVLIPGLTCGASVYDETVEKLSQNYECHTLTLAGFAGQPPLKDVETLYTEAFKTEIIKYIEDQKLENVILIGHSLGGFLSQWIATDQPKFLSKVVVIDALPFLQAASNPYAQAGINKAQIEAYIKGFEGKSDETLRKMRLPSAQFLALDSTKWDTIINFSMASDLETEANVFGELMGTDLRSTLKKAEVPILVLAAWAQNSKYPLFSKSYVQMMYSDQYKAAKNCTVQVIENTKHFIMYDDFEAYIEAIEVFVKK
jgi:N-formylmaleamate deformylase